MLVLRSPSVDSRLRLEPHFRGALPDLTSLLPPRYLSRADLEQYSLVRISRYIISIPSRYSCNSVLQIYLLILSRSCSVRSPTSVLRTPAYSPRAWTLDLRLLGPPQIEGTDGVSGRWSNNFAEALTRVRRTPDRNPGTPDSARHSPNSISELTLRLRHDRTLRRSVYGFHRP